MSIPRAFARLVSAPLVLAGLAFVVSAAAPALAQTVLPAVQPAMPVATIDQDRLFGASLYGQTLQSLLDGEVAAQNTENRGIESDLEAEERELTDRRPSLSPEEFRKLADAFDAKAEDIRKRQAAKARALSGRQDQLRATFFERIMPVLAEVMAERGVIAIIDKKAILIAFGRIDITDAAVARIDAVLGDGSGPRRSLEPRAPAGDPGAAVTPPPEMPGGLPQVAPGP